MKTPFENFRGCQSGEGSDRLNPRPRSHLWRYGGATHSGTPREVTQFHVVRDPSRDPLEVETILRDAVAHGSLIAFASDKHEVSGKPRSSIINCIPYLPRTSLSVIAASDE